jgi:hypothetical protein
MKIKRIQIASVILLAFTILTGCDDSHKFIYPSASIVIPPTKKDDSTIIMAGMSQSGAEEIKLWYENLLANEQVIIEWNNRPVDNKEWVTKDKKIKVFTAEHGDLSTFVVIMEYLP